MHTNSLPNSGFIQSVARGFSKDSIASNIELSIKTAKESEIAIFYELFNNEEISENFFNLVKLDIECHYLALQGNVALLKFYEDNRENNGAFSSEI